MGGYSTSTQFVNVPLVTVEIVAADTFDAASTTKRLAEAKTAIDFLKFMTLHPDLGKSI